MLRDMADTEALKALHLALEGALDQITRAQRLVHEAGEPAAPLAGRVDAALQTLAALRNDARDTVMNTLARTPLIRVGKPRE